MIEICLGLPGPYIRKDKDVDREEFLVSGFEQLSWVNIHKELEEAFGRPIISEHDAKLLAYAEWKCAEERQTDRHVSLVALGSVGFGIGAGIIINGKIVEGQLGIAGEIGHMGINYNGKHVQNGIQGTYEYCAGTESAVRYMLERLYEFPESPLTEKSSYWEILDAYKMVTRWRFMQLIRWRGCLDMELPVLFILSTRTVSYWERIIQICRNSSRRYSGQSVSSSIHL